MTRASLIAIGTLLFPALALAAPPEGGTDSAVSAPPLVHVVDDAEQKPPLLPRAGDLLGSHLLAGASVGPAWSLGKLGTALPASRGLGLGLNAKLDLGFGVSRSVTLGAWGSFESYGKGDACSDCAGRALGVGPFVRYQLSQGLRFDPWLTLGGGYRQVSFDAGSVAQSFRGMEWLHLELGGDYYLLSGLALGPFAGLGCSSYFKRPSDAGAASVNTELSLGLRILLDLPGR